MLPRLEFFFAKNHLIMFTESSLNQTDLVRTNVLVYHLTLDAINTLMQFDACVFVWFFDCVIVWLCACVFVCLSVCVLVYSACRSRFSLFQLFPAGCCCTQSLRPVLQKSADFNMILSWRDQEQIFNRWKSEDRPQQRGSYRWQVQNY